MLSNASVRCSVARSVQLIRVGYDGAYEFDPESGERSLVSSELNRQASAFAGGFAAEPVIGTGRDKRQVFVALYAQSGKLHVYLDRIRLEFPDNRLSVRWSRPFPFYRRFRVRRQREMLIDWDYFIRRLSKTTFPDASFFDVFAMIADITASERSIGRFIYTRTAAQRGVDVTSSEFQHVLEEHLNATYSLYHAW